MGCITNDEEAQIGREILNKYQSNFLVAQKVKERITQLKEEIERYEQSCLKKK